MGASALSRQISPEADLVADLVQELRQVEMRAAALERELANREFDIRALEARWQEAEAKAAAMAQQTAEAHARVMDIYRSRSWRIMGPYRRAVRLARRLLRRG